MKFPFLPLPGLGVLLGLVGCNTPAAKAPAAGHRTHLAPPALEAV